MVATLVVQLPSEDEGGDLVVFQGGKEVQRHDFGKKDGMSAFVSYFFMLFDAEHAFEKVTKGYRLTLVYSVCLPPSVRHLMRNNNQSLSDELGGVINAMGPKDKSFALLLSHEYTERSIHGLGAQGLKGVDRARFRALQEANNVAFDNKKLDIVIVKLTHDIYYIDDGGGWDEQERDDGIVWYALTGGLGNTSRSSLKLNFLNPGQETYSDFWDGRGSSTFEGYLGNAGPTRYTAYSRYAIVARPAARRGESSIGLPSTLSRPTKRSGRAFGGSSKKRTRAEY